MIPEVAHALRGEGFDASEDGTGRGTPLVPEWPAHVASALNAAFGEKQGLEDQHVNGGCPLFVPVGFNARQDPDHWQERTGPLDTNGLTQAVAYGFQPRIARNGRGDMGEVVNALSAQSGETGKGDAAPCVAVAFADTYNGSVTGEVSATLGTQSGDGVSSGPSVLLPMAVRRLTPRECERLQGFPDDYTRIPYRGKPAEDCSDGPRYKALGNSMAVPVMRWIGRRIESLNQEA